jgi:hypothetical protein
VLDRLKDPKFRVRAAVWGFYASLVGWAGTHVLVLITRPAELATWVGHLLLALSWFACTVTFVNIIVTTDVRAEQDEDTSELAGRCERCGHCPE